LERFVVSDQQANVSEYVVDAPTERTRHRNLLRTSVYGDADTLLKVGKLWIFNANQLWATETRDDQHVE
jgi:hypothetical protein